MKPSPGQMQLLDLAPASQAETAESLAAQYEESGPAAADFAVGSLVRCVKPTSSGRLPWGGRQGVVNRIVGDASTFSTINGRRTPTAWAI